MKKIVGRVLVKESNVGIPNLVVAAFDADDVRTSGRQAGEGIPVDRLGQRLGSVLTERDGSFVLETTDCEPAGGSARPDLVLAIFAPEDALGVEQPAPHPAEKRLLHVSRAPRTNAGSTEAYVIRLLQTQLDAFNIYALDRRDGGAEIERYTASVIRDVGLRNRLRERIAPHLKEQAQRREAILAQAREKVTNLSAVPTALRTHALFVVHGAQVAEAQEAAISAGMRDVARAQTPFMLRLTSGQLAELGAEVAGDVEPVEVSPTAVEQQMLALSGGSDLVRRRSLVDACRKAEPAGPAGGGLPEVAPELDEPPAPPTREELERQILGSIAGQLRALPSGLGKRPGQDEVNASLYQLDLKGGPADAVAFHDFHVLQMAFRHVWTQAFDGKLRGAAEELYAELMQLYDEAGLQVPPVNAIDDVSKLKRFVDDVRKTIGGPPTPGSDKKQAIDLNLIGFGKKVDPPPPANFVAPPAPTTFTSTFPELAWAWGYLSPEQRMQVEKLTDVVINPASSEDEVDHARALVKSIAQHPDGAGGRLQKLLLELEAALKEPYAFDVFAPNSYNFGVMLTYRQKWDPLTYQAGELVATIPLAPGESRKYSRRQVVKRTRAEKEIERTMSSRSLQTTDTARAEAEIIKKATTATNFKLTADGSFNIGIGSISASSAFSGNQSEDSAVTKKDFHESTLRAAEEYRRERVLEIDTSVAEEREEVQSGEISNPNNEITVTYLLYELERRYRVTEHLHRARPVILVAQDVPAPHEIDEAWLVQHQWILGRVLLDDSFRPALDYLTSGLAGDEVSIEVVRARWEAQRNLVSKLETEAAEQKAFRDDLREEVIETQKRIDQAKASGAPLAVKILSLGMMPDPADKAAELLEASRRAGEARLKYIDETLADTQRKLARAADAFETATRDYAAALQNQHSRHIAIDQLRVHVKQNILFYMQAIWDHEPPDQRFFRLYTKKVILPKPGFGPVPNASKATVQSAKKSVLPLGIKGKEMVMVNWTWGDVIEREEKDLVEVADLDNPLGYKGNYIIFPLKRPCTLTSFMLREYVDDYFGVRDPHELGNYSIEELEHYVTCVREREDISDAEKRALMSYYAERLTEDRPASDVIIVPTGQLFIEALPGRHPLLEDFKLRHRFEDLHKVQAEVRHAELENIRLAARLNSGDNTLLEDPDIEKRILVDKGVSVVVDS